jgi:hypothetical protein
MNRNNFIVILLITCVCSYGIFAQNNSNEYQQLLAKAQILFDKQPELFNKGDVAKLNDLINLDTKQFGEENVGLCKKLVEQAKNKKVEYEQYLTRMRNMAKTLDTLDSEISRRQNAENENTELLLENINLKQIIEDLQSIITRF